MTKYFNPSHLIIFLPLWPTLSFLNKNKYQPNVDGYWLLTLCIAWLTFFLFINLIAASLDKKRIVFKLSFALSVLAFFFQFYFNFKVYFFGENANSFLLSDAKPLLFFIIFISGVILLSILAWHVSGNGQIAKFSGIVSLVLFLQPVYHIASDTGSLTNHISKPINYLSDKRTQNLKRVSNSSLPNIYFFIFDGYLRSDLLKKYYKFNNDEFENALLNRGFKIATHSFANFTTTRFSLNYIFNPSLNKLAGSNKTLNELKDSLLSINSFIGDGRFEVERTFKISGYEFSMMTHVGSNSIACQPNCILHLQAISFTQIQYMKNTPVYDLMKTYFPSVLLNWKSQIPNDNRFSLTHKPAGLKEPYLLISHALIPHPPYSLDSQCRTYSSPEMLEFIGKLDLNYEYKFTTDKIRELYLNQLSCANKQMTDIADILERNDPDAVVFFVSDHGWKSDYAINIPVKLKRNIATVMRLGNFMALKAPSKCLNNFHDDIRLVESFPLLFSCILQKDIQPINKNTFRLKGNFPDVVFEDTTELIMSTSIQQ